jgi:hypothetical protein
MLFVERSEVVLCFRKLRAIFQTFAVIDGFFMSEAAWL